MAEDFNGGGQFFRVVSPEKRIVVCATEKTEKQKFINTVEKHIYAMLKMRGHEMGPEGDVRRRYGSYRFSNGAYYEGAWDSGVFDGTGTYLLSTGNISSQKALYTRLYWISMICYNVDIDIQHNLYQNLIFCRTTVFWNLAAGSTAWPRNSIRTKRQ
jgi:hypothetical protein